MVVVVRRHDASTWIEASYGVVATVVGSVLLFYFFSTLYYRLNVFVIATRPWS